VNTLTQTRHPYKRGPAEERFWRYVEKTDGCWNWTGRHNARGYGQMRRQDQSQTMAHRYAYELLVGPIPQGLTLDHLCRNPRCVNPAHLEPVTLRVNILRGESYAARRARQTHCKYGHPFDQANTHVRPTGKRDCLACRRERKATRKAVAS
jgi:hypothetical protein